MTPDPSRPLPLRAAQIDFAEAVYHDPDMNDRQKLEWLIICCRERQVDIRKLKAAIRAVVDHKGIDQGGHRDWKTKWDHMDSLAKLEMEP